MWSGCSRCATPASKYEAGVHDGSFHGSGAVSPWKTGVGLSTLTQSLCAPNPESILKCIKKLEQEYEIKRKLAFKFGTEYKEKFNKTTIAKNILNIIIWYMFL